jgi:hypothetical protein
MWSPLLRIRPQILPLFVFCGTLLTSLVAGTVMLASHTPFQANVYGLATLAHEVGTDQGSWQAIHLLSTSCSCSRGVAEHLIERGPLSNLKEHIVLAGQDETLESRLKVAGFYVCNLDQETVAQRYRIAGAPWLVIVSPQGQVRYQGGYAPAHARRDYQDEQIWASLFHGRSAESLPVLGCALGKRLQRSIDPFALKYPN